MPTLPTLFDAPAIKNGKNTREDKPDGYQHARHVGWIPEEWSERRIQSLVEELTAGTSVGGEKRPRKGEEVGVLRVSSVTSGIFKPEKCKVVDPDDYDRLRTRPEAGSVLLNRANGTLELVGVSVFVEEDHPNLYLSDKLWRITPDPQTVQSARWLCALLNTGVVRAKVHEYASGKSTGMKNVTQKDFLSIPAPVPPLEEQRRIAQILSTWDRAIEQVDALIEQKRESLHGLRQRLVTGEERFPEFDEPWMSVKIGDVFSERDETGHGQLDLLAVTMEDGVIPRDQLDRRDTSSSDKSNYQRAAPGDLVYNSMRMWQGVSGVAPEEGIVSPAYTVCKPERDIDIGYIRHVFQHESIVNLFRRYSQGLTSDTLKLRYEHFAQIEIEIPSLDEQRRIAEVLDTAETEIDRLKLKRDALKRQKKGLMQHLLTGAVRTV